jgi:hypothetical protein
MRVMSVRASSGQQRCTSRTGARSTRISVKKLRYAVEVAIGMRYWSPPHVLKDLIARRPRAPGDNLRSLRGVSARSSMVGKVSRIITNGGENDRYGFTSLTRTSIASSWGTWRCEIPRSSRMASESRRDPWVSSQNISKGDLPVIALFYTSAATTYGSAR